MELRRKILLPVFQLSEIASESDPCAIRRAIKKGKGNVPLVYCYKILPDGQFQRERSFNLFPIVLDKNGAPWCLAVMFLLSLIESDIDPDMSTYSSKADDLGAYKEWLDTQDLPDETIFCFPRIILQRPTYRFRGHLLLQVQAGEIAPNTGKRRMGTVIAFYRWLIEKKYFKPEYPPWEETHYSLSVKSNKGFSVSLKGQSTDLKINIPKNNDPFDGTIQDGSALRPLTGEEQNWVLDATLFKGNTECYLIQIFILATGARIQTVGTLRLRHFSQADPGYAKALTGEGQVFRLKAGPGTGIDTKRNKQGVLQIPRII